MIKFNWKNVSTVTKNNPELILTYFSDLAYNTLSVTRYRIETKAGKKDSFLLNIKDLLEDKSLCGIDKVVYIYLCSRRNYADYLLYKKTSLSILFCTLDINKIQNINAINIIDNNIYFKYEVVV